MIRVETSLTEQDVATVTRIAQDLEMTQAATLRLLIRRGVASIGVAASGRVTVAEVQNARKEPLPAGPPAPYHAIPSRTVQRHTTVRLCAEGYCALHGETGAEPCLRGACHHGGTPWWR